MHCNILINDLIDFEFQVAFYLQGQGPAAHTRRGMTSLLWCRPQATCVLSLSQTIYYIVKSLLLIVWISSAIVVNISLM